MMVDKSRILQELEESARLKTELRDNQADNIFKAVNELITCLKNGGKLLICGNGGSAADSQHFAAELIGRFMMERRPLPAIALSTDTSILTAVGNDYSFDDVFKKQVEALGKPGDVLVGISTSGNSANVIKAVEAARDVGMVTIGLTGGDGGKLSSSCDIALVMPSRLSSRIQEGHITIIHIWCGLIESALFSKD